MTGYQEMPHPAPPAAVSHGVRSYLLGDELLVFSPHASALFQLNPSAAFIWLCREEGLEHAAIVDELAQAFRIPPAQAERDLDAALTEWNQNGLLGRGAAAPAGAQPSADEEAVSPEPPPKTDTFALERRYKMLETVFRLRFSDPSLAPFAESTFAHLAVAPDCPFDVAVDVQRDDSGFFLFQGEQSVAWCRVERELAPLLHGQLVSVAYDRAECLIALHAGAVSNGTACLVFPAVSGSGKSTLTAALVAAGYKYCTDELVLLQAHTHQVQTIAAGIGIKSGAWEVLADFHPQISDLPTYLRLDEQTVRYLLPQAQQLNADPSGHHDVRALVFPVYQAGQEATLRPLSPATALCRLTAAGTDMDGGLDHARVEQLVEWIAGMESYELHYGDLPGAIEHVRELLP